MKKILGEMLGDKDTKKRMKVMRKHTTLHAKVKRGEKVYNITIEEITPKLSDLPDEIEIEWDDALKEITVQPRDQVIMTWRQFILYNDAIENFNLVVNSNE